MEGEDEPAGSQPAPKLSDARYSQSLERGLAILACFTPEQPVRGIAEIAQLLGMSRPTTHRYVSTLVAQGYLQRDESRKYRLALGAIDIGMGTLSAMGLCNHARPHLQALAKRSEHTAQIAVLDGLEILVLDSIGRTRRGGGDGAVKGRAGVQGPPRLPAYCTSMGKVLLAHLPATQRPRLISEMELVRRGPKTITSNSVLEAQLEHVREHGLAVNDEELAAGTCAIAAAVRDESGDVLAAVNVLAADDIVHVEDLLKWFGEQVLATAERISQRLGWEPHA